MDFENEIAPIGEVLAFGVQRRENIQNSYRSGVELDWNLLPVDLLAFQGTLTYMKSEIDSFTDGDGNKFRNRTPVLSPEWIINNTLKLFATEQLTFSVSGNYVSESYLELTNDPSFTIPDYFVMDAAVSYETDRFRFRLELNNLTDRQYYSNGAPVDVDFDGTIDEPGYFVNAPRNIFATVVVKF
jgi:iron complex outermembrane receptor protein